MRRLGLFLGVLLSACGVLLSACGSSGPGGSGGTAGGAGADAAAGAGGGAHVALTCPAYCMAIQAACTMSNQQYGDEGTCEMACPAFALGASGDVAGDTLGCRVHETELAAASASAAATHCRRAGPGGDGVCGDNCGGFCDLVMTFCTTSANAQIYPSRDACLADCAAHGTDMPYTTGDPGRTDMGSEVACQLYHGVMASLAPGEHCLGDLAMTALTCR
jgi:hypothetical protein